MDDEIIYLDHHATTPVDPKVVEDMMPYFSKVYGNPSSLDHAYGQAAAKAVEEARRQLAELIAAEPEEIIFTSGATESDNLALRGIAAKAGPGSHIITTQVEHKAILETCADLERQGHPVTYVGVDGQGNLDLEELEAAITEKTALISVMAANNETGNIYPLQAIGQLAEQHGILFHTDAAQAGAYVPLDVRKMGIHLLSLSAHKMYGPKGIGALYVRRRKPRVAVTPLQRGGGHERGIRSGTLNVPGIVGFGAAASLVRDSAQSDTKRIRRLRNQLFENLAQAYPDTTIVGPPLDATRLPHNLLVGFPPIEARALLKLLSKRLAVSTGSACQADAVEKSHVLASMGIPDEIAFSTLRFGLGRITSEEGVETASEVLTQVIQKVRALVI